VIDVVAKECWTVELAEFATKKAADAWWTVDVAAVVAELPYLTYAFVAC